MPLIVIVGVFLLIYLFMKLLPEPVRRALNFNFTDPSANRRKGDVYESRTVELQQQLLALLNGNKPKARQLLAQEKKLRPGMSEAWYLEKIVDDLRRDRI